VDGVVALRTRGLEDRRVREIEIQKLRGCVIDSPSTSTRLLADASRASAHALQARRRYRKWQTIPASTRLPFHGSRDSTAFWRVAFHRGSINLLEVDAGCPTPSSPSLEQRRREFHQRRQRRLLATDA